MVIIKKVKGSYLFIFFIFIEKIIVSKMSSIDKEASKQEDDIVSKDIISNINKAMLLLNKYDHLVRTVTTDLDTIGKNRIKRDIRSC